MSVRFQCPHCKVVRSLNPRILGREIQCPSCNAPVTLPTQADIDAAKTRREELRQQQASRAAQEAQRAAAAARKMESQAASAAVAAAPEEDEHDDEPAMFERREMPHDSVDMTPMVDITFLLLIFFMSTANFTLQKSMEVPVKKKEEASSKVVVKQDVKDSVTVQINELNGYTVRMGDGTERDSPSKQDLIIALQEARDSGINLDPPSKLIVEAHRDCKHAAVVAALDAGRDRNFSSFQVNVVESFD